MSEIRQIHFPSKGVPLPEDVSHPGQLLGKALVDQHGAVLLHAPKSTVNGIALAIQNTG